MKQKIIDSLIWLIGIIVCGIIGGALLIIMIELIDYTTATACFDYHDPDVCARAVEKAKKEMEENND